MLSSLGDRAPVGHRSSRVAFRGIRHYFRFLMSSILRRFYCRAPRGMFARCMETSKWSSSMSGSLVCDDPCTDHVKDPGWYAPEVVHWVRNALAGHEIGCHSFSHCVFGDAGCTREVAVSEVSRCRELASLHGISLTSFVFPRNSVGHLDVLRRSGFSCFRGPTSGWYSSLPKRLSRICSVIDEFLPIAPRLVTPSIEDGIVDIPGSMLIRSRNQWRKLLPVHMTERKIIRGIRRCASESGIFHLWSHPLNLAWNREAMLTMLRNMASVVAEERSKGRLRVVTMSEYADMYTSRSVPG